jgi:hypothetical protein
LYLYLLSEGDSTVSLAGAFKLRVAKKAGNAASVGGTAFGLFLAFVWKLVSLLSGRIVGIIGRGSWL